LKVEAHFHEVIIEEARGAFEPDSMRLPDLDLLRDQREVWMPIPGMCGVCFKFNLCDYFETASHGFLSRALRFGGMTDIWSQNPFVG
jgi:hypothetical protein